MIKQQLYDAYKEVTDGTISFKGILSSPYLFIFEHPPCVLITTIQINVVENLLGRIFLQSTIKLIEREIVFTPGGCLGLLL